MSLNNKDKKFLINLKTTDKINNKEKVPKLNVKDITSKNLNNHNSPISKSSSNNNLKRNAITSNNYKSSKLFNIIFIFLNYKLIIVLDSSFLVPGDIIEISCGDVLSCDCLILEGICTVNEADLTGESSLITKSFLPKDEKEFSYIDNKKSFLYHGTKIAKCESTYKDEKLLALVVNTNFNTNRGNLIQNILFPRKYDKKFNKDIIIYVVFMSIIYIVTIVLFINFYPSNKKLIIDNLKDENEVEYYIITPKKLIYSVTFDEYLNFQDNSKINYDINVNKDSAKESINQYSFDASIYNNKIYKENNQIKKFNSDPNNYYYYENQDTSVSLIKYILLSLIIIMPPILPICNTFTSFYFHYNLNKINIKCVDDSKIAISGRINTIVLDKTGTLTEEGLDLHGYQPILIKYYKSELNNLSQDLSQSNCDNKEDYNESLYLDDIATDSKVYYMILEEYYKKYIDALKTNSEDNVKDYNLNSKFNLITFLECLACCHSIDILKDNFFGNSIDKKIFENLNWIQLKSDIINNALLIKNITEKHETQDIKLDKADNLKNSILNKLNNYYNLDYNDSKVIIDKFKSEGIQYDVYPEGYYKITNESLLKKKNHLSYDEENKSEEMYYRYSLTILKRFEFSSKFQSMSVISRNNLTKTYRYFIKGAPEKILQACNPKSIPYDFNKILINHTKCGFRVLAAATKKINNIEILDLNQKEFSRTVLEKDLTFLGFIIFKNKLKKDTKHIINKLNKGNCKLIMATGDNPFTSISISKECQFINEDSKIFMIDLEKNYSSKQGVLKVIFVNIEEFDNDYKNNCILNADINNNNNNINSINIVSKNNNEKIFQTKNKKVSIVENSSSVVNAKKSSEYRVISRDLIFSYIKHIKEMNDSIICISGKAFEYIVNKYNLEVQNYNRNSIINNSHLKLNNLNKNSVKYNSEAFKYSSEYSKLKDIAKSNFIKQKDAKTSSQKKSVLSYTLDKENKKSTLNSVNKVFRPTLMYFNMYNEDLNLQDSTISSHKFILDVITDKGKIFYRMSPNNKVMLVDFLKQEKSTVVAMCGDGANDCGALLAADIGISLCNKVGNNVTSHFYFQEGSIRCIEDILKSGRACYENSNIIFKYIIVYSIIQITAVLCLFYLGEEFRKEQYLVFDFYISLLTCIISSKTGPRYSTFKEKPKLSMINIKFVSILLGHVLIQVFFQILISYIIYFINTSNLSSLEPYSLSKDVSYYSFIVLSFQCITIIFLFNLSSKYKKEIFTNKLYLAYTSLMIFYIFNKIAGNEKDLFFSYITIFSNYHSLHNSKNYNKSTMITELKKSICIAIVYINIIASSIYEYLIHKFIEN